MNSTQRASINELADFGGGEPLELLQDVDRMIADLDVKTAILAGQRTSLTKLRRLVQVSVNEAPRTEYGQ